MERRRSHTLKVGAGLWRANIRIDNHGENLGNFAAEEDAARAFDRRARQVGRASNFPTDHQVAEAEVSATLTHSTGSAVAQFQNVSTAFAVAQSTMCHVDIPSCCCCHERTTNAAKAIPTLRTTDSTSVCFLLLSQPNAAGFAMPMGMSVVASQQKSSKYHGVSLDKNSRRWRAYDPFDPLLCWAMSVERPTAALRCCAAARTLRVAAQHPQSNIA
jgi:hypothetical protein